MSFLAQHPWVAIAIGTIMVAGGGFIATWGWNKHSELQYRENFVSSVIHEWRLNDRMVEDALSLARRWNEREDTENFSHQPYKAVRLNALISSGIFGSGIFGDLQRSLVRAIENYESAIGDMTAAMTNVGRMNPGLFIKRELIHDHPGEMPVDEEDLLAPRFLALLKEHRRVGNMLEDRYPKLYSQVITNLE